MLIVASHAVAIIFAVAVVVRHQPCQDLSICCGGPKIKLKWQLGCSRSKIVKEARPVPRSIQLVIICGWLLYYPLWWLEIAPLPLVFDMVHVNFVVNSPT